MDITGDIARYSMDMASARVASSVQTAMAKNVMELQEDTMAQLLQTMGMGGSLNVQA